MKPLLFSQTTNLLELQRPRGRGMYIEMIGYGTSQNILLRLEGFLYLQVFRQREEDGYFIDTEIDFSQSDKDFTLADYMAKEVWESSDDATHYLSTLMHYCQQ